MTIKNRQHRHKEKKKRKEKQKDEQNEQKRKKTNTKQRIVNHIVEPGNKLRVTCRCRVPCLSSDLCQ